MKNIRNNIDRRRTILLMKLLWVVLQTNAIALSASAAEYKCKALFKLDQAKLPDWFKDSFKAETQVFFEKLDAINTPTTPKVKLNTTNVEMQKATHFVGAVLKNKNLWREFTVGLSIEFAEYLNQREMLITDRWRLRNINLEQEQKISQENIQFVKEKINPLFKEFLVQKLNYYGFNEVTEIQGGISRPQFRQNLAEGKIFWDNPFIDGSHGADTHMLQVLMVSQMLEIKYGRESALNYYKFMGTKAGIKAWTDYYDGFNSDLYQPELLSPVLRIILPAR